MSNINNIMNGLYGQYIDHDRQQDIANSHLCDTEPPQRYFTFEVIETRYEVTRRTKYFRIDNERVNGDKLADIVGNHMTSDEFYDFVNDNGEFIKDYAENITEDVQEIVGNVWEA
jgi:hypothetical protein